MENNLVSKILQLKKQRQAVILAHNYQIPEVQDIADFVGDSLGLSQQAAQTKAKVIVFCGVYFMAETASILSPDKTVLIPDPKSDCPMAKMITATQLRALKKKHPKAIVVCYVNTTAEVKAESDICCTSANAAKVVQSISPKNEIIFVPDKHLGHYTATQTKRDLILWPGYCPTHVKILPEHIKALKKKYPKAEVMVHPECLTETTLQADKILSTSGMLKYAKESKTKEFIVGTEIGLLHTLRKENPDKQFYPATETATCPNMKRNTLEKVLWALEEMKYEVKVPEAIRIKAKKTVDRMLDIGRSD